jgi:hypothetical protein
MANPVQWTIDQLLSELASIKAKAQAEFAVIGQNNAQVVALYAKAGTIKDPTQRAQVRGALEAWAARQARLQSDFNTAWGRYQAAYNAAASFLRSVGINAPASASLSGLGAVPLIVPVAVVSLVVIALAWLASVHENNLTQRQMLANQAARFQALASGQINLDTYLAASKADGELADKTRQPPPKDPLGDLTGMIIPALAIVAAIVLGPRLLELMPRRGAA